MMQWDFTFEHWLEMEREKERTAAIRNMIKYGVPKNQILRDYSEEYYERAQNSRPMNI